MTLGTNHKTAYLLSFSEEQKESATFPMADFFLIALINVQMYVFAILITH